MFQQPGTPAATCLLVTLGRLRHYQNRDDLAIVPLTQAYQSLVAGEPTPARIQAAIALNLVFLATRDFEQALAMNQEVIDWDLAHGAAQSLSTERFRRGEILTATHDYEGAFEEFTRARELSTVLVAMKVRATGSSSSEGSRMLSKPSPAISSLAHWSREEDPIAMTAPASP